MSKEPDKIERYGWTVIDERGMLEWIDKNLLHVDHEHYQRGERYARVLKLASEWSWIACGSLTVARRENASLWVMDGQTRKLAADKRSDIQQLPCVVFRVRGIPAEARAFVKINTSHAPAKGLEVFGASLTGLDPDVIAVNSMFVASGYRVANSNGMYTVACTQTILRCYRQNPGVMSTVWGLVAQICQGEPPWQALVGGLFYLESALLRMGGAMSIFQSHNMEALLTAGPKLIGDKIRASQGYHGKGGPRIWAQGIIDLLNHKRSSRKLPSVIGSNEP